MARVIIIGGGRGLPMGAKGEEELIKTADEALYKAKGSGKNRVCCLCDTVFIFRGIS